MIPSASLVPVNDPSVLFTTAGMHPLVPYLTGTKHPSGQRLVNVQRCMRTGDVDDVGDTFHHTFFEMLGNWSVGDANFANGIGENGYWKEEAIKWSFEFLTSDKWLGIPVSKLAITVFEGDNDAPFDEESYKFWRELGIIEKRIIKLPKKNNWWGQVLGPCGPNTEMFYWSGDNSVPESFDYRDTTWVEIWNDVFMEYDRKVKEYDDDGRPIDFYFDHLKQKNVDTGMGLERTLALMNGIDDNYRTKLFWPIIEKIEEISGKKYSENKKEMRIIADHIKAAVMAISDGAVPSNKDAGYVIRRLIRRSVVKANRLGITENFTANLANSIFLIYQNVYQINKDHVLEELNKEETKFRKTLNIGLKILDDIREVDGQVLFHLFQTYGLPVEVSLEEAKQRSLRIVENSDHIFESLYKKHQDLSRTASAGMFKGGLADNKVETTRLHTAAHLLLAALRQVLSPEVSQKGSNITEERLRFDFNWPEKLTSDQIAQVEKIVNEKIRENLPVEMEEMSLAEAKSSGAGGVFDDRYGEKVKVYTMGLFSREICGGPHVKATGELGTFKITKEESSSAGIRRIKAILE